MTATPMSAPSAAAASEAGFRPCLRCRPECAPGTPAWAGTSTTVQRGLRLIAEGALDDGNVEHLADRLIHDVFYGLRMMVKGRHRWQDVGTHVGGPGHQLQMPFVQRGLPDHQDQPSFLFQGDVRGPDQQIFRVGVGDPGQCFNGAGRHDHAVRQKCSAGRCGRDVPVIIDVISHIFHL